MGSLEGQRMCTLELSTKKVSIEDQIRPKSQGKTRENREIYGELGRTYKKTNGK